MERVLHIPNYYNPHIGGIETVCEDIVTSLNGEVEQKIICFKDAKKTDYDNVNGVDIVRVGCIAKVASQSIAPGYGKELKKLMNEFKPTIVIFHYPNPYVARYLLKYSKRDFKLVLYWHLDITKQKVLKLLFTGQTKRLLKRANKVIATSPNYVEKSPFLSVNKDKTIVIPNCVNQDVNKINPNVESRIKEIKEANNGKTVVFALGRHVEYKGMIHLVNASKFLGDEFRIYIAGAGPLTDSLKEAAKGDTKVTFLGKISDDDVKAYLSACDIFAFPSITKNEAFGIALAEAMSFAKPAVTFTIDGSGVNYVSLDKVTGLEVENSNDEAFAEALKKLAENEELRLEYGKNAALRVNELFTFETFKQSINNLIKEL